MRSRGHLDTSSAEASSRSPTAIPVDRTLSANLDAWHEKFYLEQVVDALYIQMMDEPRHYQDASTDICVGSASSASSTQ